MIGASSGGCEESRDIEPEVKDIGGPEARREFPWFYVSHLHGWLAEACLVAMPAPLASLSTPVAERYGIPGWGCLTA
jgi:hypothetical protein